MPSTQAHEGQDCTHRACKVRSWAFGTIVAICIDCGCTVITPEEGTQ